MDDTKHAKILADYEKKADAIIMKMYHILSRVERKTNDEVYKKTLASLDRLT